MIDESDQIARGRKAWRAYPACRFVENLARRIFQSLSAGYVSNDCQTLSVWRPVGPLNIFFNRTRRAPREHGAGERPRALIGGEEPGGHPQCKLSTGRDAEQISVCNTQRAELSALRPRRKELAWFTIPSRRINDRFSTRGEARPVNCAPLKRKLVEARWQWNWSGMASHKEDNGSEQRGSTESNQSAAHVPSPRRTRQSNRARARSGRSGERIESKRHIPCRLKAVGGIFLETVLDDSRESGRDVLFHLG